MFRGWTSPEAVFGLLRELSRGRPCDFTGVAGYDMLEAENGVQWPHPEGSGSPAPERRLFGDGKFFHPRVAIRGRLRFVSKVPQGPHERGQGLTDLLGAILWNEMDSLHNHFPLIAQCPAKLALSVRQHRTRLCIDEKFRDTTLG